MVGSALGLQSVGLARLRAGICFIIGERDTQNQDESDTYEAFRVDRYDNAVPGGVRQFSEAHVRAQH